MSDIAMLVAEEYERRVKNARQAGGAESGFEIDMSSCASVLARSLKMKIAGLGKLELLDWVREPRTQISLAASTGFFSA
ncbi:uncharacterized protein LOC121248061 [Juglans microcarpa x Juglans regia]|uniref:uncharacterized protein LOC121248061 n=1 Tax=Juglans microcarpa x Juglans regia TaxID=2249226 RepID=UPI001B7DF236|nr:uncharacterized protein LOC121248061 [Juglans microcarpa x Juglans regia]